jgi:hypothetical protein
MAELRIERPFVGSGRKLVLACDKALLRLPVPPNGVESGMFPVA